jgi:hypothetical protein
MAEVGLGQLATLVLDRYDDTTSARLTVYGPPMPGPYVQPLIVDPPDPRARAYNTRTDDGGKTWTAIVDPYPRGGLWYHVWTVSGMGYGRIVHEVPVVPDKMADPGFTYATSEDLANWLRDAPPADCERMLAEASREVDRLCQAAVYAVDPDTDKPLDPRVAAAMRDATCELVRWWAETGDDTGVLGAFGSLSAGSISVGRATAGGGAAGVQGLRVSAQVRRILQGAGLLYQPPTVGLPWC